ncbi:MAG TPA: hypothetical protein VMY05_11490 [Acidobacteriota bacterium]|nr:hypothetical protein [Acidobacteriota bacterium]
MVHVKTNPFNITQAKDFSDEEILQFWVDLTGPNGDGGFDTILKPRSPVPMLLLGSKGSGKTHLLRYYSFRSQSIRNSSDILKGLTEDGYIGIYVRMGGLNAQRFSGKGMADDYWARVFQYYLDLWLAQVLLNCVTEVYESQPMPEETESSLCKDVWELFTHTHGEVPNTLRELCIYMSGLQKQLDRAVNDISSTSKIEVDVTANPGYLIFGIPKVLAEHLSNLKDCVFVYLIDELENITEEQQKYVNTLIKEKENPSTFKVGARLYGHRTYYTLSANEMLVEGSEFEEVRLDDLLRNNEHYEHFAMRLIARRLIEHSYFRPEFEQAPELSDRLLRSFEGSDTEDLEDTERERIMSKYVARDRPYFARLRSQLSVALSARIAPGLQEPGHIEEVISQLAHSEEPLLEKLNIFLFYRAWKDGEDLLSAATCIQAKCSAFVEPGERAADYDGVLSHFKSDLLAQLRKDCGLKQRYRGLKMMISMSWGVPRSLLVLLKRTFDRALFRDEDPFKFTQISIASQEDGVRRATDWFYADAKIRGRDGSLARDSIGRLATLFRSVRFSDKPSECSLVAFSTDLSGVTEEAQRIIKLCCDHSLLVVVSERQDRNSERIDKIYQLNRMLAPRWDLPIFKRGDLALDGLAVSVIFDHQTMVVNGGFDRFFDKRLAAMMAPHFGSRRPDLGQPDMFEGGGRDD